VQNSCGAQPLGIVRIEISVEAGIWTLMGGRRRRGVSMGNETRKGAAGNKRPDEKAPDTLALLKAIADSPRRDNSSYHDAMAQARQAFEAAEEAIGGPVRVKTKFKTKRNGDYVVKWIFKPAK
jgi:hypothetical protein